MKTIFFQGHIEVSDDAFEELMFDLNETSPLELDVNGYIWEVTHGNARELETEA